MDRCEVRLGWGCFNQVSTCAGSLGAFESTRFVTSVSDALTPAEKRGGSAVSEPTGCDTYSGVSPLPHSAFMRNCDLRRSSSPHRRRSRSP